MYDYTEDTVTQDTQKYPNISNYGLKLCRPLVCCTYFDFTFCSIAVYNLISDLRIYVVFFTACTGCTTLAFFLAAFTFTL